MRLPIQKSQSQHQRTSKTGKVFTAGEGAREDRPQTMKKKVDILINGKYECSTRWAWNCKDAVEQYKKTHPNDLEPTDKITAQFDHNHRD